MVPPRPGISPLLSRLEETLNTEPLDWLAVSDAWLDVSAVCKGTSLERIADGWLGTAIQLRDEQKARAAAAGMRELI